MRRFPILFATGALASSCWLPVHAEQVLSPECEQAWATYNEFKDRTVMEESQYTLTVQGAAVRAACGKDALPAPPKADIPPKPRVRKPSPVPPLSSPSVPADTLSPPAPKTP